MQLDDCLFCKIARGEIGSAKVYEDEDVLAFKDISPKAPVHFLIVPKQHITSLAETRPEDAPLLGKMLSLASVLAKQCGCENGFRTIINTGRDGGQEVQRRAVPDGLERAVAVDQVEALFHVG